MAPVGPAAATNVRPKLQRANGGDICRVQVDPCGFPVDATVTQLVVRRGAGGTLANLTGGALLSVGSWAFMFSVFAGGYALAYVVRRAWR